MAYQGINTGTTPNDGTGDTLVAGGVKINSNFTEIYNLLGNGTTLAVGVVSAITAGTNVSLNTTTGNVTVSAPTPVSIATTDVDISRNLKAAGITTLGVTTTTSLLTSGITTLASQGGVTTTGGDLYIGGDLYVQDDVVYDEVTGRNINISGVGTISHLSATTISASGIGTVRELYLDDIIVLTNGRQLKNITSLDAITTDTIETAIANSPNNFSDLNVTGVTTTNTLRVVGLATVGSLQSYGESSFGTHVTIGGSVYVGSGLSVTGICTAASYLGDGSTLSGVVTTLTGADGSGLTGITTLISAGSNITVTTSAGITTISSTGGVGVGTTNVSTNTLVVSGVSTLGVVTGATYYGDGSNLTGISVGVGTTANVSTNTLVVSGVSTVGVVTGATYFGDASDITHSSWTLGADGSTHYQFTGPGGLNATADPVIYLARGQNYEFVNNMGAHPFEIRSSNGGSAFSTGVTNNAVSNGTLRFEVPFSAPNSLYYQCTSHAGMGGTIVIYPNLFTV